MQNIKILKNDTKNYDKFKTKRKILKFEIIDTSINHSELFKQAMEEVVSYCTREIKPSEKMNLSISCTKFKKGNPVNLGFQEMKYFKIQHVLNAIDKISQKNYKELCSDVFTIHVTWIKYDLNEVIVSESPIQQTQFLEPNTAQPPKNNFLFIFYALLNKQMCPKPNLLITSKYCHNCIENQNKEDCVICGFHIREFGGESMFRNFFQYIIECGKNFDLVRIVIMGKSLGGNILMLNHILENTVYTPEVKINSLKVYSIKLKHIRFLDSEKFITSREKKNVFNTTKLPENIDSTRIINDLSSLTNELLELRNQILAEENVCPLLESSTLTGAMFTAFKRNYLENNTIALVPTAGYRINCNYKALKIQWILSEEKSRGIQINHLGKNFENIVVCDIVVDGLYEKHVFMFYYCNENGHSCKSFHPKNKDRNEKNIQNRLILEGNGYQVIEKWECEFLDSSLDFEALQEEEHSKFRPLNPKEAFFGQRSESYKMYHEVKEDEVIKHCDMNSLSAWNMKFGAFPVGRPTLHLGHNICTKLDLDKIHGLVKCTILPPRNLYIPILPCKVNNGTYYTLCSFCAKTSNVQECNHNENERALSGTWVIFEIREALKHNYRILNIQEIWEYNVEKYDPDLKTGGLFTKFCNKYMKIKQEASGWPDDVTDQPKYIRDFEEKEGIKLDPENISNNDNKRSMAKNILNSFWSKFSQNTNTVTISAELTDYLKYFASPSFNVNYTEFVGNDKVLINWKMTKRMPSPYTISIFCTAQGRLRLLEYLNMSKRVCLFCENDSLIYIVDGNHKGKIETGNYIGDMKDELSNGFVIREYLSGGSQTYAYTYKNSEDGKLRVSNTTNVYKKEDYDKLKRGIFGDDETITSCRDEWKIIGLRLHQVQTKKTYKVNFTKRKLIEKFDSLPYGYKKKTKFS